MADHTHDKRARSGLALFVIFCFLASGAAAEPVNEHPLQARVENLERLVAQQARIIDALSGSAQAHGAPHRHLQSAAAPVAIRFQPTSDAPPVTLSSDELGVLTASSDKVVLNASALVTVTSALVVQDSVSTAERLHVYPVDVDNLASYLYTPRPMVKSFDDGTNTLFRQQIPLGPGKVHWVHLAFPTTVAGHCELRLFIARIAREFVFGSATIRFHLYSETDGDFRQGSTAVESLNDRSSNSWSVDSSKIAFLKVQQWNATANDAEMLFKFWTMRFPLEFASSRNSQVLHASLQCVGLRHGSGSMLLGEVAKRSSCNAHYEAGDRGAGVREIYVDDVAQQVFCDNANFGGGEAPALFPAIAACPSAAAARLRPLPLPSGFPRSSLLSNAVPTCAGWTLVMKGFGSSKPSNSEWNSGSPYNPDSCRSITDYGSDPDAGDASGGVTCQLGTAFVTKVRVGGLAGRTRFDFKGQSTDTTVGSSPSCQISDGMARQNQYHHCKFVRHGFGSGMCPIDNSQDITDSKVPACDCCSRTDYTRSADFSSSSCTVLNHVATYGAACDLDDSSGVGAHGTMATAYRFDDYRRWLVDGNHHGDTVSGMLDFRAWIR